MPTFSPFMLPFFVIVPVIIAIFLFVFSSKKSGRIIAIAVQTVFVAFAFYMFMNSRGETIVLNIGDYAGVLGIILRVDNLAAVFVLLVTVIFLAVAIYSIHDETSRLYWFLLFLLEAALIGLFLTRDFFNIFVLIEVSTLVVSILLMYDRNRRNMYAGMKFLMVNIVVMQFYLFGLGYLYMITGVLDMQAAADVVRGMDRSSLYLPYALIMTAVAAKCSLLPLLTWLPKVNSLPGARSSIAAIMSAVHVKSGIYIFIRFQEVFADMASEFFMIIGIITAVVGIVLALAQTDIRLILAYSTIAQVGLIMIGLNLTEGYDYYYSFTGAVFHIVNHAVFKAGLFLCAGMLIYRYKTSDITKMRGIFKESPVIAIALIMAILGIIGTPLFNGSISKYFLMSGTGDVLEWIIYLINLGTILVFTKFFPIFFGSHVKSGIIPDRCKMATVVGLGVLCFALGVFGQWAVTFLFNIELGMDIWGYLQKSIIFVISVGIAFLIYKYVLSKKPFLAKLKTLDLGFGGICASIGVFFAIVLIVLGVG